MKPKTNETRALVRSFIKKPTFENFYKLFAYLDDGASFLCIAADTPYSIKMDKCDECPLHICPATSQLKQPGTTQKDVCDYLIGEDGMRPTALVNCWDKHKGVILLQLIQFKESW